MTDITLFASKTGSNIVTGLTATAAEYDGQLIQGSVVYGLIKYTFSGAPDLSSVLQGHSLNVTGFTNANNNGSGMYIQSFSNVDKTITVKMVERTNNSEDETGASASATVTTAGAEIKELSVAKNAQGFVTGEKVSAGHLNWIQNQTIAQAGEINSILTAIDVDDLTDNGYYVGRRLTAGDNVTLSDNGDSTERIDVGAFGKSTTAEVGLTKALSAASICKATLDASSVSAGRLRVYADDVLVATAAATEKDFFMFDATSEVEIRTENILLDINNATYDSLSGSIDGSTEGLFMRATEDKFFIVRSLDNLVRVYTCTAGDISTPVAVSAENFNAGSASFGIFFKPDGTEMYLCRNDEIDQFTLATPWNPSTAGAATTYTSPSFVDAEGLHISPDGLHCFVVEDNGTSNRVYQLAFGTAWDVSTLSDVTDIGISPTSGAAYDIMLNSDGTKLYVLGNSSTETIYQYTMSTAWDLDTATYDSLSLSVNTQDTLMRGLCMVNDLAFYTAGQSNQRAYQYTIGTEFTGTARYSLEYGAV